MKWLCCRDFVFVRRLTGERRPHWSAIICMLNTPMSSLMLTGNTGSAMCHSCKVRRAKVTPHTNTHTHVHSHTLTHIPRELLSSCVLFHVFILGLLMRRVVSGILSGPSDMSVVVQPSSPFDPQEKDCCRTTTLALSWYSPPFFFLADFLLGCHWFQFTSIEKSTCSYQLETNLFIQVLYLHGVW